MLQFAHDIGVPHVDPAPPVDNDQEGSAVLIAGVMAAFAALFVGLLFVRNRGGGS